jgi:Mrp family chromosome partitioning ATPase
LPTREGVMKKLESIVVPGAMRSLVQMNLVRDIGATDGKVEITLATVAVRPEVLSGVIDQIGGTVGKLRGVKEVKVNFVEGTPKDLNEVGHVIAIMSGKGGVGKSLVAGLAAIALRRQGYEVGILDADVTGPSIPRMFGINTRPSGSESGILPVSSRTGIQLISMNLLLPSEDSAVIWRGPLIAGAITQFWEEVLWGKLDYLIVDLPPGTADAPLTVLQTLPISGIVVVFTPQDLTAMIVRKAIDMARHMDKPILGVVENMTYLYVPELDKKIEVFGRSRGEEMALAAGAPLLGQIPMDPGLARLCDDGNIEVYDAEIVTGLGRSLAEALTARTALQKKQS